MMQSKFYQVTAKCGHVGRNQYYEGTFYTKALTGSEAAAIVRNKPRVKHDHRDAILSVQEISVEEYKKGMLAFGAEAYFLCQSRQDQNFIWDIIVPKLRTETGLSHKHRQDAYYKKFNVEMRLKKPYRREKLSLCYDDLEFLIA